MSERKIEVVVGVVSLDYGKRSFCDLHTHLSAAGIEIKVDKAAMKIETPKTVIQYASCSDASFWQGRSVDLAFNVEYNTAMELMKHSRIKGILGRCKSVYRYVLEIERSDYP